MTQIKSHRSIIMTLHVTDVAKKNVALHSADIPADILVFLNFPLTFTQLRAKHHSLGVGDGDTVDQSLQSQVEVDKRCLHSDLGHAQPQPHVLGSVLHEEGDNVPILRT